MTGSSYAYPGTELELFARAVNWKRYWALMVRDYIRGHAPGVGAGFGSNTPWLFNRHCESWTALEPDPRLVERFSAALTALPPPVSRRSFVGTLKDLPDDYCFDTVIYIDVLEHIEDDRQELAQAASRLTSGGHLIVLAPAHQWLFSHFDVALGHYRRYTRASLQSIAPHGLRLESAAYLDGAGILASLANRLVLARTVPSLTQVLAWDRLLVPMSRWCVDPLVLRQFGKTVLAVWKKEEA